MQCNDWTAEPGKSDTVKVLATCKCGTQRLVKWGNLRQGISKSCGCRQGGTKGDLTGQVFGKLTVTGQGISKRDRRIWECTCVCGNNVEVNTNSLVGKNTTSCGCQRRETMQKQVGHQINEGQIFGRLTVTKVHPAKVMSSYKYDCKCECGTEKTVKHSNLYKGITKSCGCLRVDTCKSPEKVQQMMATTMERYGATSYYNSVHFEEKYGSKRVNISKAQIEITEYVNSLGFNAKNKWFSLPTGKTLEVDIFIEELNFGIEYHGLYFHSEACKRGRNYHLDKLNHANENNYQLMQIFEDEWRDRKDQVKSFIFNKLNKTSVKLSCRDVEFKEVSSKQVKEFCELYHMQGDPVGMRKTWGAYYKDELIFMCVFAVHHRDATKMTLRRVISKPGFIVRGALSKITKIAYETFKTPIITWVDRRYSEGKSYLSAGFVQDEILGPDYSYILPRHKNKTERISKQSRQKKKCNTPADMTESEHARLDGLFKIWDCGKIRFVYNPNNL